MFSHGRPGSGFPDKTCQLVINKALFLLLPIPLFDTGSQKRLAMIHHRVMPLIEDKLGIRCVSAQS
jgi:hypothetical protein